MRIVDWDDAYANRDNVPGADAVIARWQPRAAEFRNEMLAAGRAELDLAYGPEARQRLDLFQPAGAARGLAVFVHGGYWHMFDKSYWSHLAAGPLAHGWAVAVVEYRLAPEVRISRITGDIAAAIGFTAARSSGPLLLAGHSAGGHLVTRMACADGPLPEDVRTRLHHVLSISGVHDLRPLRRTAMNATLGLSAAEAVAESPALSRPIDGLRVTAWVGGDERPEFVRQTTLLANIWTGLGADMRQVIEPGRHHFDVIDSLAAPDGGLTACLSS